MVDYFSPFLGKIIAFGSLARSVQGWVFVVTVFPTLATFISTILYRYDWPVVLLFTILAFSSLCMLAWGVLALYDRFFPAKGAIPLTNLFQLAQKYGWNFTGENLEILDFMDALRQAANDNRVIFSGRPLRNLHETLNKNELLVDIPASHWMDFWIDWSYGANYNQETGTYDFERDNFRFQTYNLREPNSVRHADLHVKCDDFALWLKVAKKNFAGRRQLQEDQRIKIKEGG